MMARSKLLSGTMRESPACETMVRITNSIKTKKTQVMVASSILLSLSLKQRARAEMQIRIQQHLFYQTE